MVSDDRDSQDIAEIARTAMAALTGPWKPEESPGLNTRFRCPKDRSTNTQAIQAILDASITSLEINGKRVPAVGHSPLLQRYRIGPKPRIRYEFILFSGLLCLLALGVFSLRLGFAMIPLGFIFLASSGLTFWIYWDSRERLAQDLKDWEDRRFNAEHKWHCHQCGNAFLPGREADQAGHPQLPPEEDPDASAAAENVSPLHPSPLRTDGV